MSDGWGDDRYKLYDAFNRLRCILDELGVGPAELKLSEEGREALKEYIKPDLVFRKEGGVEHIAGIQIDFAQGRWSDSEC